MEIHVHFIAVPKIGAHIFGPLVGFGKQHRSRSVSIDKGAQALQEGMGFGQVLAARAFTLKKIRRRIHADTICSPVDPELTTQHGLLDFGVIVVQVGLVVEKAMPEIGFAQRVISPVGFFEIDENDARVFVGLVGLAPDVVIAILRMFGMLRIA